MHRSTLAPNLARHRFRYSRRTVHHFVPLQRHDQGQQRNSQSTTWSLCRRGTCTAWDWGKFARTGVAPTEKGGGQGGSRQRYRYAHEQITGHHSRRGALGVSICVGSLLAGRVAGFVLRSQLRRRQAADRLQVPAMKGAGVHLRNRHEGMLIMTASGRVESRCIHLSDQISQPQCGRYAYCIGSRGRATRS